MFCRATVRLWEALFVLLTVALPLHAQSVSGCFPPLSNSVADHDAILDFPHYSPENASNHDGDESVSSSNTGLVSTGYDPWSSSLQHISDPTADKSPIPGGADHAGNAKSSSVAVVHPQTQPNVDPGVYYRNKLEFAFDSGWLPKNIPFVFDIFMGDAYNMTPLRYTLVPLVASLRWHIDDVGGPWILRGNWDMTASGSITLIPRGPESRYFSYDMGVRRNFVPRRGKIAPYFDGRLGLGEIDAKERLGVQFAQGQNFTFTVNLGAGARYNFNPRYSISAGLNWMHISNLYLSEPAFSNYGINVYGPMFGIDIRLSKPRHSSQ